MSTVDQLDVGPVNVTGAFRANKARVILREGRLHIFQSATRHVDYEISEVSEDGRGGWTAELDDGSGNLAFARKGCSCGYTLSSIAADDLLAVAVT